MSHQHLFPFRVEQCVPSARDPRSLHRFLLTVVSGLNIEAGEKPSLFHPRSENADGVEQSNKNLVCSSLESTRSQRSLVLAFNRQAFIILA
jgi:hypothetical protein